MKERSIQNQKEKTLNIRKLKELSGEKAFDLLKHDKRFSQLNLTSQEDVSKMRIKRKHGRSFNIDYM